MPIVLGQNRTDVDYRIPVTAPDPLPPALSLLKAATTPEPEDGDVARHWPEGISFLPHTGWQAETIDNVSKKTSTGLYPGIDSAYPQATRTPYIPWTIQHAERVSTIGFEAFPFEARVKAGLVAKTPSALEYEFWTGEIAQAAGYPNHYLAMPTVGNGGPVVDLTPVDGGGNRLPVAPRRALGYLEQALANAGSAAPSGAQAVTNVSTGQPMGAGRRGMVHCLPEIIPMWGDDVLRREGALLLSQLDTVVIPGSGYPGTGPGGIAPPANGSWLYATSWVHVRMSDVYLPDPDYLDHIERTQNTVTIRAQRDVVAYWDHIAHFAILAELEGPVGI